MKATGIVRNMDNLGRLCFPKEVRRVLKLSTGDPVEFFLDGDALVLRKYDAVGDMEQLLDSVVKAIELNDPVLPQKMSYRLLGKVKEMKAILAEESHG